MPQIINTNLASLNSQRHLNTTQTELSRSLERLSSGKRINSAKDDAAGLGIAERMTSQINGMNQAIRNSRDGISLGQTAEGALSTMNDMIQRTRVLAVQASNATNSPADRQALQDEVGQLISELNRIAEVTTFNGQYLLNGTMGTQYFQVGPNAGETIGANGTNFLTNTYGNYRVQNDGVAPLAGVPATGKAAAAATITGYLGSANLAATATDSARTIAEKVNLLSGDTGVTATARTTAHLNSFTAGETYAFEITSNNTTPVIVSFAIGNDVTLADSYAAAVNSINTQTAKTGVSAEYYIADNGGGTAFPGIRLTNATGNDIGIKPTVMTTPPGLASFTENGKLVGGTAMTNAGLTATGMVTMDSPNSFVVINGTPAPVQYPLAGTGDLMTVATMDVTTFENAQKAIQIADSAMIHIVGEMARYGALQARFEETIQNLETSSENTTNSRSRIEDADFAAETAALSRATILQQAGISMLSQANQLPQMVLNLLQ